MLLPLQYVGREFRQGIGCGHGSPRTLYHFNLSRRERIPLERAERGLAIEDDGVPGRSEGKSLRADSAPGAGIVAGGDRSPPHTPWHANLWRESRRIQQGLAARGGGNRRKVGAVPQALGCPYGANYRRWMHHLTVQRLDPHG